MVPLVPLMLLVPLVPLVPIPTMSPPHPSTFERSAALIKRIWDSVSGGYRLMVAGSISGAYCEQANLEN